MDGDKLISVTMDGDKQLALISWINVMVQDADLTSLTELKDKSTILLEIVKKIDPDIHYTIGTDEKNLNFICKYIQDLFNPDVVEDSKVIRGDEFEVAKLLCFLLEMTLTCPNNVESIGKIQSLPANVQTNIMSLTTMITDNSEKLNLHEIMMKMLRKSVSDESIEPFPSPSSSKSTAEAFMESPSAKLSPFNTSFNTSSETSPVAIFAASPKALFRRVMVENTKLKQKMRHSEMFLKRRSQFDEQMAAFDIESEKEQLMETNRKLVKDQDQNQQKIHSLQDTIIKLKEEIEFLQLEVQAKDKDITEQINDKKKSNEMVSQLQDTVDLCSEMEAKIQQKQKLYEEQCSKTESLTQKVSELAEKNTNTINELLQSKHSMDQLKADMQKKIDDYSDQREHLQEQINRLEKQLLNQQHVTQENLSDTIKRDEEISTQKTKIDTLLKQVEEHTLCNEGLNAKINQADEKCKLLEKQIEKFEESEKKINDQIQLQSNNFKVEKDRVQSLNADIKNEKERFHNLNKNHAQLEDKLKTLNEENNRLLLIEEQHKNLLIASEKLKQGESNYAKQVEGLTNQSNQDQKKIEEYVKQITDLNELCEKLRREINRIPSLETQIDSDRVKIKQMEEHHNSLSIEKQNLNTKYAVLQSEKEHLEKKCNLTTTEQSDLEKKCSDLLAEKHDVQVANSQVLQKLQTLEEKHKVMCLEKQDVEGQYKQTNDEKNIFEGKYNQICEEKQHLTDQYNRINEEKQNLTEKCNRLSEERQKLTEQCHQITEEQRSITEKWNQISEQRQTLTEQCTRLGEEKQYLTEQCNRINGEKQNLTEHCNRINGENQNLTEQCTRLGEEKQNLTEQCNQINGEKQNLTEQCNRIGEEKQYLTEQCNRIDEEKQNLIKKCTNLIEEKQQLEETYVCTRNEKQNLEEKCVQIREERDKLEESYVQMSAESKEVENLTKDIIMLKEKNERIQVLESDISGLQTNNSKLKQTYQVISETKQKLEKECKELKEENSSLKRAQDGSTRLNDFKYQVLVKENERLTKVEQELIKDANEKTANFQKEKDKLAEANHILFEEKKKLQDGYDNISKQNVANNELTKMEAAFEKERTKLNEQIDDVVLECQQNKDKVADKDYKLKDMKAIQKELSNEMNAKEEVILKLEDKCLEAHSSNRRSTALIRSLETQLASSDTTIRNLKKELKALQKDEPMKRASATQNKRSSKFDSSETESDGLLNIEDLNSNKAEEIFQRSRSVRSKNRQSLIVLPTTREETDTSEDNEMIRTYSLRQKSERRRSYQPRRYMGGRTPPGRRTLVGEPSQIQMCQFSTTETELEPDDMDHGEWGKISLLKCTQDTEDVSEEEKNRLAELQRRNTLCLPHLKSSYPMEVTVTKEKEVPVEDYVVTGKVTSKRKFDIEDAPRGTFKKWKTDHALRSSGDITREIKRAQSDSTLRKSSRLSPVKSKLSPEKQSVAFEITMEPAKNKRMPRAKASGNLISESQISTRTRSSPDKPFVEKVTSKSVATTAKVSNSAPVKQATKAPTKVEKPAAKASMDAPEKSAIKAPSKASEKVAGKTVNSTKLSRGETKRSSFSMAKYKMAASLRGRKVAKK